VRYERLNLSGDPVGLAQELRALIPAPEAVAAQVTEIIARVRASGDDALRFYTREYDTGGTTPAALRVPEAELDTAEARLDDAVRGGLRIAMDNVTRVAEAGLASDQTVTFDGHEVLLREVPVASAAVYVPGGRAPYPSTVIMGVVTARVAGVQNIAVCAPPGADGEVNSAVLGACRLAGASVVYRMGGAQAIAALAFGTETVSSVDVIVGPGNLYVQEAKRQVFGKVGIDMIAGPSEVLVIADHTGNASWIAADLLAQAEHDAHAQSILITDSERLADAVEGAVASQLATLPRADIARASWNEFGAIILVRNLDEAVTLANAIAAEHLEIMTQDPEALSARIRNAGAIFLGAHTPEAIGDYVGGSNHVLPTARSARFSSGLGVLDFMKRTSILKCGPDQLRSLAPAAMTLGKAEGLDAHARSVGLRLNPP
jgi:histidinol dehydrogenase